MYSDIEHDLKVKMLKDIECDSSTDGYDIVKTFLSQNAYIEILSNFMNFIILLELSLSYQHLL